MGLLTASSKKRFANRVCMVGVVSCHFREDNGLRVVILPQVLGKLRSLAVELVRDLRQRLYIDVEVLKQRMCHSQNAEPFSQVGWSTMEKLFNLPRDFPPSVHGKRLRGT